MRIIAAIVFLVSSLIANAQVGHEIKLQIKGAEDSLITLGYYFGDNTYKKSALRADNEGKVTFTGEDKLEKGVYLIVLPGKKAFELIIDDQIVELTTSVSNPVEDMNIIVSDNNKFYYDFLKETESKSKRLDSLQTVFSSTKDESLKKDAAKKIKEVDKEIGTIRSKYQDKTKGYYVNYIYKLMENPQVPESLRKNKKDSVKMMSYYREHYWDGVIFSDESTLKNPYYNAKLEFFVKRVIPRNLADILPAIDDLVNKTKESKIIHQYTLYYLARIYERSKIMESDSIFIYLAKNHFLNDDAKEWLTENQRKRIEDRIGYLQNLLIGKKAPNITFKTADNDTLSIHSPKAEYKLLFFYDPDCGHCKQATPVLRDWYKEMDKDKVTVLAISTGTKADRWMQFIDQFSISDIINLSDHEKKTQFREVYQVYQTPKIYILDSENRVIYKKLNIKKATSILSQITK